MKNLVKLFCLIIFLISAFLLFKNVDKTEAAEAFPFNGVISSTDVLAVIHNTPDYNTSSEVAELINGTKVLVTGKSGSLYKIIYEDNKEGYVASSLVNNLNSSTLTSNVEGFETYNDYCNSLIRGGFDNSYCPYLYYLHIKYPKWTFKADYIGYTIDEVASKEEQKVSLQTSNSNYWYYENNQPKINEAASPVPYYFINKSVIASLVDPRNSLFENLIFQFLNLEKTTDAMNEAALISITGQSGNLKNYTNEFMKAANQLEINALHLMARSKQEGANKVGYAPTSGTYTTDTGLTNLDGRTLNGFYNFYNIGTYVGDGYKTSIQRGLAYAAGYVEGVSYNRPWDTPEKAVIGGGEWIGNLYVKRGQNTNYFQKFNVSSHSLAQLFGHQYMTNGAAPTSESNTIFKAYKAGDLLNSEFEFLIPVYKDMPGDGYQADSKNANSALSSITVDDKVITGFNSEILEYNYNAVTKADSIKVGAKTLVSTSSVTGTGDYTFVDDKVTVTLTVTAENGTSTIYKVNIIRVSPDENVNISDIISKMGVKVSNDYMYGISPDTSATSLMNTVTKNKGVASITNANNVPKSTGSLVTGDKITIQGTTESKTYIIAVRGDINGDGVVKINDLILIQSHILSKAKLTNEKFYAADINYDSVIKINDLILVQSNILGKNSL